MATASNRALGLHEIISAVLSHLRLPDTHDGAQESRTGMFDYDALPDSYYNEDGDHDCPALETALSTAEAAARSSLRSAALVNRMWFAAAVPLLWQRPSSNALAHGTVRTAARRRFYASYIRHVFISGPCQLWGSLANSGASRRSSTSSGSIASSLTRLPRLITLRLEHYWPDLDERMASWSVRLRNARSAQAPLERHIGLLTEELCCHLTESLMDCLEEVASSRVSSTHRSAPAVTTAGAILRPEHMRLSKLLLFGDSEGGGRIDDADEVETRLLQWLNQIPYGASTISSVRLISIFCGRDRRLMNRAFRCLAFRPGLKRLWLGHESLDVRGEVSAGTIHAIASTVEAKNSSVNSSSGGYYPMEQPERQSRYLCTTRRPFAELRDLHITIRSQAMQPLARLLTTVTHLSVVVCDAEVAAAAADTADMSAHVFSACASLLRLRVLRLRLRGAYTSVTHAAWHTLHALTQLRELSVSAGRAASLADDDVAAVLLATPRLRTLALCLQMPGLTPGALRVIGVAAPQLRRLHFPGMFDLAMAFDNASASTPIFPALEYLALDGQTVHDSLISVEEDHLFQEHAPALRAEAERHARLLQSQAPMLDWYIEGGGSSFADHVHHTFYQLTKEAKGYTEADIKWSPEDMAIRCGLCEEEI